MITFLRRGVLAASIALAVPVAAHAQTTVNFWDMIWGPSEYIDASKKLVDQFNASQKDIVVKYRSVPWANWYQTYVTAIGAGTAPDISTGAGYQAVQFAEQGAIRPMDDVIAEMRASGELDDFMPGTVERLKAGGHYVALPWAIDIRVMFARKDMLAAANVGMPQTWADFRAAAKTLTKDGKYGFVGSGDTGGSHYLYALMLNNGGGLFTEKAALSVNTPRNIEALTFLSDLVRDGSIAPASAGYDSDGRRRAFLQGQAAFIIDGPGFADSAPAGVKELIALVPPLAGPHGDKGTIAWVNNIMIYQQTKVPEQTKTFLKWWSKNQLLAWTEGHSRNIPARKSIAANAYFTADPIRKAVIETYLPVGKGTGFAAPAIFPALNAIEGDGVMQSLAQEILQGKDVAPALARAEPKLKEIVQ
jgi:multiple sugar transport system substrate-binding protein